MRHPIIWRRNTPSRGRVTHLLGGCYVHRIPWLLHNDHTLWLQNEKIILVLLQFLLLLLFLLLIRSINFVFIGIRDAFEPFMFSFRQICLRVRTAMSPSYIEDFEQWRTIFVPTSSPRCLACGCGKGSNYTGATNVLLSIGTTPRGLVIREDEKGISLS